jgi:uncharacterized protein (TIGR04255 family)
MTTSFSNAPLVELIAELRWDSKQPALQGASVAQSAPTQLMLLGDPTGLEEFFLEFGRHVYDVGFPVAERLVPHGFPMIAQQPAYRFRPFNRQSNLYQVGPGLFTANAIPPYQTWAEFRPVIANGVNALLKARVESEKEKPITTTSLRYIDAFGGSLIEGHDTASFLEKVLGFKLTLPPALSGLIPPSRREKPTLQLQLPMDDNVVMQLLLGEGLANGQPAFILDTSMVVTRTIEPSTDDIMQCLDRSHAVIHDVFLELTKPIAALMRGKKDQ